MSEVPLQSGLTAKIRQLCSKKGQDHLGLQGYLAHTKRLLPSDYRGALGIGLL